MKRRMSQWGEAAIICIMAGLLAACGGGSGSSPANDYWHNANYARQQ